MLSHRPAPHAHADVFELQAIAIRLQQEVDMTTVVVAVGIEFNAMPNGPLIVHVVVARQQDNRARKTTELFAHEIEVVFEYAAVIEQVPDDQQEIGFFGKRDVDDPSERALGRIAEAAGRLAADSAIEMDIGGMNEFD